MNGDSELDQLFQTYREACPDVEPGANFMPQLWQRIEGRHAFGFVFQGLARTTVTVCAALCLLLVFLNFVPPFRAHAIQTPNYTDVLMTEHNAENTDYTESIRASTTGGPVLVEHSR
jgi:Na+-transporting NADH:ubiquinone oxidoreductase subunit NqrB